MTIPEIIQKRRSIRKYLPQEVEKEKLELLVAAAMTAPTACNSQPWEFVIIKEQEVLQKLQSKLLFARYNAPAGIVVCGNLKIANNSAAKHYWVQDCSAATENILLTAVSLGLGSVWIGVYPLPSVIKPVSEILNLPEYVIPLNLIYVGYPAEEKQNRPQLSQQNRIHWEIYEPRKRRAKVKNAKLNV
ncbi:MAG: nitroreductase family protein [Anaerolineaceae bacterium]|nr:nitroreductase family protein [Anaerolineaceae bacterium]